MKKRSKSPLKKGKRQVQSYGEKTEFSSANYAVHNRKTHQPNFAKLLLAVLLLDVSERPGVLKSMRSNLTPPQLGEFALYMILTKEDREYLIGDLAEEFIEVQAKFGRTKASIWYYKQVLTSAWPLMRKAIRLGILAWVGEWIRRRV